MTPYDYCVTRVGGQGSNVHYSLLFASVAQREAITAVYAFVHEVDDVIVECHDAGVAQTKLAWWHEELARLYGGDARHPVTQALVPAIQTYRLEQQSFLTILHETAAAFARTHYDDFEMLYRACQRTDGVAAGLAAMILGSDDTTTHQYAEALGAALRLTDILNNVGQDLRRGRLYLPADDLRRFGVSETDLSARRESTAFTQLMQFETERNLEYYDRAFAPLTQANRVKQLPGIILANIARTQLSELRRDGYRVLDRRLALTPLRKLWIAWRTRFNERQVRAAA